MIVPAPRDPSVMMRAAHLYYVQDKSQAEIARIIGIDRSNVSRMLAEAKRQGIVEIRLHDPSGRHRDLEDQLMERFGLSDARVAPRGSSVGSSPEDRVGALAARLLLESIKDGMTVALSWGRALQTTVYQVVTDVDHDVTVVQLLGGMAQISNEISGQELIRELAVRLGASYRLLHAPATVENDEVAASLLAEPSLAAALELARAADVAFVGVGDPAHGSSAAVLDSMNLDERERDEFWAAAPVGDLAGRYFTATGAPLRGAADRRLVSLTLDELDHIPLVVGVVTGRSKTDATLGALRGRHLDALVCDESLARALLTA